MIKKEGLSDLQFKNILPDTCNFVTSVSWITIDGITYKPGKCFILVDYRNTEPFFALLHKIIYIDSKPVFVCKIVKTIEHNLHFNAYEISVTKYFKIYKLTELFVNTVYQAHQVDGKYYIVMKRSVGNIHY